MAMEPRLRYKEANPEAAAAMAALQGYLHRSGLDQGLVKLIEIRASQINRCGY